MIMLTWARACVKCWKLTGVTFVTVQHGNHCYRVIANIFTCPTIPLAAFRRFVKKLISRVTSIMSAADGQTDTGVISGFRREVDETCALLCYYAAYSGNFIPTFRDNPFKMGLICCPETWVRNYPQTLRNNPEERRYNTWLLHYTFSVHVFA
jgi:hypothetical protein